MPFIPAIVGTIAGAAAPIVGGLFGGGKSKQAQQSTDYLAQSQKRGFELSDQAINRSQPFFSQANQYIPQAASYYQSLLSGRPGAMAQATAPERDSIAQSFQSARSGIMAAPRGGGRTSVLAQLPTQQAAANARTLMGVRPQAAAGLLSAGSASGNMLTSLLNTGVQGIYGTSGAANSLLNYDLQRQAADRERGGQLGSSIFDLIKSIPFGKKGGGGGGGDADVYWDSIYGN